MGISRLFRATLALTFTFLLIQCGGVGVSKRSQLAQDRAANSGGRNSDSGNAEKSSVDQSSKNSKGSRSASGIEAYFNPWMNTPYLFGGNTFSGVDCSGLVNRFFADQYGLDIPRTTTSQYMESEKVPKGREKPGDLVFFSNTYRAGISHVGIYLGEKRFVHAANSGVIISNLNESYFKDRFEGFRRFNK